MRIVYPRASGDQRIFREDFLNIARTIDNNGEPVGAALINRGLSAGQVRYYGAAYAIAYAGAVSIASHVIISASGANQALWSIGTAASRRMEVGIDATGRPYAWGTAQVLLGTAVSDGHHDLGFSIGSDGSVWCVVDGELWGSGTVTFGATFDRMVVGGSCLGTLPWAGATKDVHIYRGQIDLPFSPESWGVNRIEDWTADDVLLSGASVTAWVGQRGTNWTQADPVKQGQRISSHAPLGGKPAVHMTNDHYTAVITHAGTSWSLFVVCDQDSVAATDQYLVDVEAGRSILTLRTAASNAYKAYNNGGFWSVGGAIVPGADSLCFVSDGTNLYLYRAGVLIGSQLGGGVTAVQIGFLGTMTTLGANYPNSGGKCDNVYVARVCFLNRAATATDQARWFAWTRAKYGV